MNAGVGAAGALRQRRFAGDALQGSLQLALDCRSGLHLPAVEVGAIVGKGELPGLRSRPGGFPWRKLGLGASIMSGRARYLFR